MQMFKSDKIFIGGHRGLIGSAIKKTLANKGYQHLLLKPRSELDLMDLGAVEAFFTEAKPDVVFLAAARVGGIFANNTYRANFIYENLQVQNNVIWAAYKHGVRRLLFLGSSCIYPRETAQPMPETCLLSGALEFTNRPYAIAKIAGLELVNALRKQHGKDYFSVMPTNLFGPNDNFHPDDSHVLPALLRRFAEAATSGAKEVKVWGTGNPRREFMYSFDCAEAIVHLAESLSSDDLNASPQAAHGFYHINIGVGADISIKELAHIIAEHVGFTGKISFDTTKPDGTMQKLLDISYLKKMGWESKYSLADGIKRTVDWYQGTKEKRL